jgi:iron complex transport system substrate-binding protein
MGRIDALLVCLALALGACGGQSSEPAAAGSTQDAAFPVTIEAANGDVEMPARPKRIVSLSPTATEILFAIGAGTQVVAVDDQSDYPPRVPTTDLSGYEPNVEAIAKYEPDLVVSTSESGLKSLSVISIPLLVLPAVASLHNSYLQFEQLGIATGHAADAAEEVARIKSQIQDIVATVPEFEEPPTYYHELDNTYYTATSDTFIGRIYELAGLRNIADKADKSRSGYPQLSAEYIVQADPDLIFLADSECCDQTPERVAQRPGWDQISAVENGAIFEVSDDISSRWGPRVVDFSRIVVEAVRELAAAHQ